MHHLGALHYLTYSVTVLDAQHRLSVDESRSWRLVAPFRQSLT